MSEVSTILKSLTTTNNPYIKVRRFRVNRTLSSHSSVLHRLVIFIISIFVSLALSTHPSKVLNVLQQSQWGLPHVQIKPVCLEGPGENFAFDLVEGSLGAGLNVGLQDSLSR